MADPENLDPVGSTSGPDPGNPPDIQPDPDLCHIQGNWNLPDPENQIRPYPDRIQEIHRISG